MNTKLESDSNTNQKIYNRILQKEKKYKLKIMM